MSKYFEDQKKIFYDFALVLMKDPLVLFINSTVYGLSEYLVHKIPLKSFLTGFGIPGRLVHAFIDGQIDLLSLLYTQESLKVVANSAAETPKPDPG